MHMFFVEPTLEQVPHRIYTRNWAIAPLFVRTFSCPEHVCICAAQCKPINKESVTSVADMTEMGWQLNQPQVTACAICDINFRTTIYITRSLSDHGPSEQM